MILKKKCSLFLISLTQSQPIKERPITELLTIQYEIHWIWKVQKMILKKKCILSQPIKERHITESWTIEYMINSINEMQNMILKKKCILFLISLTQTQHIKEKHINESWTILNTLNT